MELNPGRRVRPDRPPNTVGPSLGQQVKEMHEAAGLAQPAEGADNPPPRGFRGALDVGQLVQVNYPVGNDLSWAKGTLVDWGAAPAPWVLVDRTERGPLVIFLGPGVTIAPTQREDHPAL